MAAPAAQGGASPSSRLVIGTAGHVDHGKTALVRRLTGLDTDRLPEEKARGISIELGFAPLTLADGRRAAVVDVPGHERFLRMMLAGVSGVDLVLLVIAADEGVMPQTREHLDVCGLLGLRRGLVALTKVDLVDPALRALAIDDVTLGLRGSFLELAPLICVSSVTGEGLPALQAALARAAAETTHRPDDGPARLPIDRVFTVKGAGTVVTGTLAGGRFQVGDPVVVLPGGAAGRVRGIEVHGDKRTAAQAGERTALNLTGIDRDQLPRGLTVVTAGPAQPPTTTAVDVQLTWLAVCPRPLRARTRLLFHALATQETATVDPLGEGPLPPGGTGFARIHLDGGVALCAGDRFVLRGFGALPGHGTTVGGGRIIRLLPPRRTRRDPALLACMASAGPSGRVLLELEAAGPAGLPRPALLARTGLGAAAVEQALAPLLTERRVVLLGGEAAGLLARPALEHIETTILDRAQVLHDRALRAGPAAGIPREALRTSTPLLAALDQRVFAAIIDRLHRAGRLELDAELVRHPDMAGVTRAAPSDLEAALAASLAAAALAPPPPAALATTLGLPAARVAAALELLLRRGEVVKVGGGFFFARAAIDQLRARLRGFLQEHGAITTQQMKALVGGSRRYAIPLAEHFDAEKMTLRVGEVRRLRGRAGGGE